MKLANFLLRVGLAVVFFYAATAAYLEPHNWIGFLPSYFRMSLVLALFSAYQIVLALWLLSGKAAFWSALLSAATLLAIIFQNTRWTTIAA
ncbi:hypothetical protein A3G55_01145 [Candidatus Giovannonibacteria bacterium RIFCSPLOWO2_12_FULL_44_25]|uniref:DoxX family protein n=4 Tax=Parcubacteria group TaxID=1794811 RepID=A0A837IK70_9BACT|nr:MAG: hypothetical protein UW49_C0020G0006 [Candidatus Giovannonibacteria bacterium GW2011_GWB1_44_23]KKT59161.1 MAG: hypothetical protein UW53_C0020G0006 [Candidatus Giovannonibacteria bacterium GW2011_GWA1_44_25]KKT90915.1 MAG: hypothetical protein UW93_C0017G0006 [Parcubacteria group bacterium GW2011_GWC1_45_13]KKU12961.1 MAG: hypothetical protein UX18_C0005G0005 [Candidatus Azambacteria bacterium GW2011_GWC2_45_7b]OGF50297.1 MAG: hypothetical protein A2120_01525 [Candidatus Giovannonibact